MKKKSCETCLHTKGYITCVDNPKSPTYGPNAGLCVCRNLWEPIPPPPDIKPMYVLSVSGKSITCCREHMDKQLKNIIDTEVDFSFHRYTGNDLGSQVCKDCKPEFECRVCGGDSFKQRRIPGSNSVSTTLYYSCTSCGVMFIDKDKFNGSKPWLNMNTEV